MRTRKRSRTAFLGSAVLFGVVAVGCGRSSGRGSGTTAGSFTTVGPLATGRVFHAVAPIAGTSQVLVVGGKGRSGTTDVVLDSAELFDPATGGFTPTTGRLSGGRVTGQNGRMAHAAVALPTGKVVLIGGQTDVAGHAQLNTCEVFDPATDTFSGVPGTMTLARSDVLAIPYAAGGVDRVLIAGGWVSSDPTDPAAERLSVDSVDVYRADQDVVEAAPAGVHLVVGRFGARAARIAVDAFVIVGGVDHASLLAVPAPAGFEVCSFDAAGAPAFSKSGSLNVDRFATDVAMLGSHPAAFGGRDAPKDATSVLDTIELYDPSTNAWSVATARLHTPRQGHTVTRLANGDLLVVGGASDLEPALATTEIVSGSGVNATVVPGPPMRTARRNHTATLLATGRVLIVGGEDAQGVPLASAEVFAPLP